MKKIYEFVLEKDNFVEKPIVRQDANGKEIKVLEKVNEKISNKYFIRSPDRKINEEQEFFVAGVIAECDKRGILRRVSLQKRYLNDGDILSLEQRKAYDDAKNKLWEKQAEYYPLNNKKDKTKEETEKLDILTKELFDVMNDIQGFELKLDNELYQFTAEYVAQNRLVTWQTIMLSYEEKDGKQIPIFGSGTYEERSKKYDEMKTIEDEFTIKLIDRLSLVTSLWSFGKAREQEDFEIAIKWYDERNLVEAVKTLAENQEKSEPKKESGSEKLAQEDQPILEKT